MTFAVKRQVTGDFDATVARTIEALKAEGFGVLTEIDIQATMRAKLGACNPPLARAAIEAEPSIGVMLPCNVIVRERSPGRSEVAAVDPEAVIGAVDNRALATVSRQVSEKLRKVVASIGDVESRTG